MGPLKLLAVACVLLTAGLVLVGMFVNAEGDSLRDTAREARHERRQMINLAMQQQSAAQNMVRMRMEAQMAEFENYENFEEEFEKFVEMQYIQAQQYEQDH